MNAIWRWLAVVECAIFMLIYPACKSNFKRLGSVGLESFDGIYIFKLWVNCYLVI